VLAGPFHRLQPDDEPPGERLWFSVTANAVWAVNGEISFPPLDRAAAISGGVGRSLELDGEGRVVTSDGGRAHIDGGPLDLGLGHAVIPLVHLTAGVLRPLRSAPVAASATPPSATELARDQLAAVTHRSGPARILAPAGSGKTRVLTERTRYLVETAGVVPRAATLVAFNRRARQEMVDRLGPDSGRDVGPVTIRTLNSLALAITAGRDGFAPPRGGVAPTTITEPEVRRILSRLIPGRRRRQLTDPLEPWIDALSACRLGLRDPDEVADAYGGDVDGFPEILDEYRRELRHRNVVDFDEQVVQAVERLATEPDSRAAARGVTPVLLVDEFQDLTPAHLLLVRLVTGPAAEVFCVGDDDQTIYGYSGASPRWLVDFDRYFPGAVDHPLTVNYRCPRPVVSAAGSLLSHNRVRVAKTVMADPRAGDAHTPRSGPSGLIVYDKGDAQDNLVRHVQSLLTPGEDAGSTSGGADGNDSDGGGATAVVSPEEVAVLARVNAALLPAALFLESAGIPTVRPPGLDHTMLDRSGASATLAWLRLATGPARGFEPGDLRLVLRRPPRSLHPRIVDWVCEQESVAQLERLSQRLNTERDSQSVQGLADDIGAVRTLVEDGATTEQVLSHVYERIGLLGAAGQLDGSQRSARRATHSDDLAALVAVARLEPDPGRFESWLREGLLSASRSGSPGADNTTPTSHRDASIPPAVTLATIHTTKGLEWPHVIVHDCRDGLYPHRLADDVEEERRIFHVGITRGIQSVAVTVAGPPSPFVAELSQPRTQPWPADGQSVTPAEPAPKTAARGVRPRSGRRTGAANAAGGERTGPASAEEAERREALTRWRSERAKADSVPAYVVMNNRTLDTIARHAPSTLADLAAVPGIGPVKLEAYGDEILGIVA
jgi:DNA helicase-2/ATP-dependent DNA helicase PcrA